MMQFTMRRDCFPEFTYSVWYDENNWPFIKSIEKPWKDNKRRESCIPEGIYLCTPFKSPKHGDVYLLKGTEPRIMIEIHPANFESQLEGCIAPGMDFAVMVDKNGKSVPAIAGSKVALQKLKDITNYKPFQLIITKG